MSDRAPHDHEIQAHPARFRQAVDSRLRWDFAHNKMTPGLPTKRRFISLYECRPVVEAVEIPDPAAARFAAGEHAVAAKAVVIEVLG
jgi:hypothetical protein